MASCPGGAGTASGRSRCPRRGITSRPISHASSNRSSVWTRGSDFPVSIRAIVSWGIPARADSSRCVSPARRLAYRVIRPAMPIDAPPLLMTFSSSHERRVAQRPPTGRVSSRPCPSSRRRLDPTSELSRANRAAMEGLVAELRRRHEAVAGRGAGGDDRSIARHRDRGKLPVRERIDRLIDPGTTFLELSALAANGMYDDEAPGRRHRHGARPGRGHPLRDRRQRRHGQGRHLLPDDGQEAPARPGDRPREPPALCLSRRFGRRVPAAPGRGLPRPRALRADLLQPGPAVGGRHPAGRPRDGLQHRRRRLRPGDERRDGHRPRHRHDLPRRTPAGEGRNRRGGLGRGARRVRRPHANLGRGRPRGARRCRRAVHRPIDRPQPEPPPARSPLGAARARTAGGRRRRGPTGPATSTTPSRPIAAARSTSARSSRDSSTGAGSTSSRRSTATPWSADSRTSRGTPSGSSRTTASSSASRR